MLLERDTELRAVDALLARTAGGDGAVVFIEGAPGIGKSSLLRALAQRAAAQRIDVLQARGSQLERPFSFGVARQLLERRLEAADATERSALLNGAARAAPAALGLSDGAADEGLRGLHSLYWLVANLAGRRPLVISVDDAHWADRPSLRWLAYAADRLDGVPLLLAVAARASEPDADQDLLDGLALGERATVLRPQALTGTAVAAVVDTEFDAAPAPAFSVACGRATGGNPLLLRELVRELAAQGVAPTAEHAGDVLEFGADGVARTVRRRLAALRPDAARVAECAAIAGEGEPLARVARVAGLEQSVVRAAVVELIATDVLVDAEQLAFVHPLVRAAVDRAIPVPRRTALHAAVARDLADHGAAAERVAVHLLLVAPAGDAWVVEQLVAAGADAASRGAPEIAARFLARALAEPPAGAARVRVLHALGNAQATTLSDGYEEHLSAVIAASDDPEIAGEAALTLARGLTRRAQLQRALAVLEPAIERAPAGSTIATRLEAELLGCAASDVPFREHAAELIDRRLSDLEAGTALDPLLLAPLAGLLIDHAPLHRARATAQAALAGLEPEQDNVTLGAVHATFALIAGGAYADALRYADLVHAEAARRGSALDMAWSTMLRAEALFRMGNVIEAEAAATIGHDLVTEFSAWNTRVVVFTVGPLIARGALGDAERLIAQLPEQLTAPSHVHDWLLVWRAELRREQGRMADAIADLRAAAALFAPGEFPNPFLRRWRGPLALALASIGERDEARALATSELTDARRFDAPELVGRALVASGVVEGGEAGVQLLEQAVDVLSHTQARLEHARALVSLGTVLRTSGRREAARVPLRAGMDRAARCGASLVADRAHAELVAAGGRPRQDRRFLTGPESLTAGEHRVAVLAATGLTNREVAQQLYVTQAAVQFHLRGAFRKLDITSRAQLAAALAGEPVGHRQNPDRVG